MSYKNLAIILCIYYYYIEYSKEEINIDQLIFFFFRNYIIHEMQYKSNIHLIYMHKIIDFLFLAGNVYLDSITQST